MNRWIVITGLLLALLPGLSAANETDEGTWLTSWLEPVEKDNRDAALYLAPLEPEGDLWAFELYYSGTGEDAERTLALKGYLDGTDFKEANVVGRFIRFDRSGEVDEEGHNDSAGEYHGDITDYGYDGYTVTQYFHGKKHGHERHYHDNGQLEYEVLYLEGEPQDGERVFHDEEGNVRARHEYKGHKRHGNYQEYVDGVQVLQASYRDGRLDGWYQRYDSDGELTHRQLFSDGKADGVELEWSDGVLSAQRHYQNDKLHGSVEEWEDGILTLEGEYHEGQRKGLFKEWQDGVLLKETDHISNWHWTEQKQYHPDGTLKTHARRNDDNELVEEYHYDADGELTYQLVFEPTESGRLKRQENYEAGQLARRRLTVPDRDWTLEETLDPTTGRVIDRREIVGWKRHGRNIETDWQGYRNSGEYREGTPVGEHILEDPEGNPIGGGRYRNGEKIGPWVYREGENLVHESFDQQGRLHGPRKVVTLDGVVRLEAYYVRGEPHGDYAVYQDEKPVTAGRYHYGKKVGQWIEEDPYDYLSHRGRYDDGKETGEWVSVSPSGYERARMQYHEGELHGTYYSFALNGRLTTKRVYEHGELQEEQMF